MTHYGSAHQQLQGQHRNAGKEAAQKVKNGEMTADQLKDLYKQAQDDECGDDFKEGWNEGQ